MRVYIGKKTAAGTLIAPPSKSFCHRALICAALAKGKSILHGMYPSADALATASCLSALGAKIRFEGDTAYVSGFDPLSAVPSGTLSCGESGSTLRFLLAIALLSESKVTLCGTEKLLSRPLSEYEKICREQGLLYEKGNDSVSVRGRLKSGTYNVSAEVSSQFASGLMMALPLLLGDSNIILSGKVASRSYLLITAEVMRAFGAEIKIECDEIKIKGGAGYKPREYTVEGDCSGAAFFEAMNRLGSDIKITGLNPESVQGDRVFSQYFDEICSRHPTLDITDCPDLAPVLMALGAAKQGVTLTGTARLRAKESDRGSAMAEELCKLGIKTELAEDTLTVFSGGLIPPKTAIVSHKDHRIVMAMTVLLMLTGGEIDGAEDVKKSFPDFFERLSALGAEVKIIGD